MASWPQRNPGFDYTPWDEQMLRDLPMRNIGLFDQCMNAGVFDAAADVARVEVLSRFGGVYADADSVALRPLEDAPFMHAGFFATREEPPDGRHFVTNAFMGCAPHHPVIERYLARLSRTRLPKRCVHGGRGAAFCCAWKRTGPTILTDVLATSHETDIEIVEPWVFFAETIKGAAIAGGEPYARHFWSSTGERTADKTLFPGAVPY
jgi:mannosyltransferase OCH1-like enzyme